MIKRERINRGFKLAKRFWRHKYFWAIAFFVVVAGFVDQNSFLQRYRLDQQASDLRRRIKSYQDAYDREQRQLDALDRDPQSIVRIARERYFMKRADEDIYVIEEDASDADAQTATPTAATP